MIQEIFDYCPDCVKFINKKELLISFYDLQQDGSYKGGLGLYYLNKENLKLEKKDFFESTGIFDFFVINEENIVSANVDKSFSYYKINNSKIEETKKIEIEESKPLYLDIENEQVYSGMENGYVSIFDLNNPYNIWTEKIHEDNVWVVKKAPKKNILLTGSDDTKLKIIDIKEKEIITSKKPFFGDYESGVTAIEFDKDNEHIFYCGCFNSQIKVFDLRNLQQPILVKDIDFNAGIWRIVEKNNLIALGLSYSNKFQIFNKQNFELIYTSDQEHDSLVYGIDFSLEDDLVEVLSVSFYDKKFVNKSIKIN